MQVLAIRRRTVRVQLRVLRRETRSSSTAIRRRTYPRLSKAPASGGSDRPRHGGGNVPVLWRAKWARFLGLARRSGLPRATREPARLPRAAFHRETAPGGVSRRRADLRLRAGPSLGLRWLSVIPWGSKRNTAEGGCSASGVRC